MGGMNMEYNKNNPLKVFTAFSGYDSQMMALQRLKDNFPYFDFECVGWSEIDENAIIAHNACFPNEKGKNYGDIDKMIGAGIAKTNLYKLAGNSIVVSCMYHIFRKLFVEKENENQQLELF